MGEDRSAIILAGGASNTPQIVKIGAGGELEWESEVTKIYVYVTSLVGQATDRRCHCSYHTFRSMLRRNSEHVELRYQIHDMKAQRDLYVMLRKFKTWIQTSTHTSIRSIPSGVG